MGVGRNFKFRLQVNGSKSQPADVPKPHHLLPRLNLGWFYFFGTGLPRFVLEKDG